MAAIAPKAYCSANTEAAVTAPKSQMGLCHRTTQPCHLKKELNACIGETGANNVLGCHSVCFSRVSKIEFRALNPKPWRV